MMSDFMFPIYLATNKIQKKRRETGESEKEQKAQLKIESRKAHGRPRQTGERDKANAQQLTDK